MRSLPPFFRVACQGCGRWLGTVAGGDSPFIPVRRKEQAEEFPTQPLAQKAVKEAQWLQPDDSVRCRDCVSGMR